MNKDAKKLKKTIQESVHHTQQAKGASHIKFAHDKVRMMPLDVVHSQMMVTIIIIVSLHGYRV